MQPRWDLHLEQPPPPAEATSADPVRRVAVLLNGNAKQVNDATRRRITRVIPAEHLFYSRTPEEANEIADRVVARRYGTVFSGGGDGTFVAWVNRILDRAERRAAAPPRFGVLPLGTGNAVAVAVGTSVRTHLSDLARYLRGERATRRLDLLTDRRDTGDRRFV